MGSPHPGRMTYENRQGVLRLRCWHPFRRKSATGPTLEPRPRVMRRWSASKQTTASSASARLSTTILIPSGSSSSRGSTSAAAPACRSCAARRSGRGLEKPSDRGSRSAFLSACPSSLLLSLRACEHKSRSGKCCRTSHHQCRHCGEREYPTARFALTSGGLIADWRSASSGTALWLRRHGVGNADWGRAR